MSHWFTWAVCVGLALAHFVLGLTRSTSVSYEASLTRSSVFIAAALVISTVPA